MNINATLFGQIAIVLAIFFAVVGYFLGRRKSKSPVLVSFCGFLCGFFPPFGLVFLLVLLLRKDIPKNEESA
ncbi:hypothetical protein ACFO4O_15755 [Glaciecola siphonariae]|uniref:Uncharacterized protein n=1 Tax=Glaciecola siphonariae TaxID=521012 RepID=A0ABV9LZ67_9ALTE